MITDQIIAQLVADDTYRWNGVAPLGTSVVVTYSFGDDVADYDQREYDGITPFTNRHRDHVSAALDVWDAASGIDFIEVDDAVGGQMRFMMIDMDGRETETGGAVAGFARFPFSYVDPLTDRVVQSDGILGDVFLSTGFYGRNADTLAPGVDGFRVLLHEIGHALGFAHPEPVTSFGTSTVMSYVSSSSGTSILPWDEAVARYFYGQTDDEPVRAYDADARVLTTTGSADGEWLLGFELDDVMVGGQGDDRMDGGEGIDEARFAATRDTARVTENDDGVVIVDGPDGRDVLTGIESLRFADTIVYLDDRRATTDDAREIALIYEAAFDRDGGLDLPGFNFWIDQRESGRNIIDIAGQFVEADEFGQLYGPLETLTNREVVEIMYRNTLDREGESDGVDYWTGTLAGAGFGLDSLVYAFAISDENLAGSAYLDGLKEVDPGFWSLV